MPKKTIGFSLFMLFLVFTALVFYWQIYLSSAISRLPLRLPETGAVSFSQDGSLVGLIVKGETAGSPDYILEIKNRQGQIMFSASLKQFNPYTNSEQTKIVFSPANHYAVLSLNDLADYRWSRLFLIDLAQKTISDLADEKHFGPAAKSFGSLPSPAPIWLDEATILFEQNLASQGESLKVLTVDPAVAPGLTVGELTQAWQPTLSPDRRLLAVVKNGEQGRSLIQLVDLTTKESRATEARFQTIYSLAWSPDGRHLAFGYTDEAENLGEAQSLAVMDIVTGGVIRLSPGEYLTSPQWLTPGILSASYWTPTPFRGNNVHTFTGLKFFDITQGHFLDQCLKGIDWRYTVNPAGREILFIHKNKMYQVGTDRIFYPAWLDRFRTRLNFGLDGLIASGQACLTAPAAEPPETDEPRASGQWLTYNNNNFGLSFDYPADWELLEASGPGYMNLALGQGADGIEVQLFGLSGENYSEFTEENFRKTLESTVRNGVTFDQFEKITLGENECYRALISQDWKRLSYSYYVRQPVFSPAMPQIVFIPNFRLNSYSGQSPNSSQAVVEKMLASLKFERQTNPWAGLFSYFKDGVWFLTDCGYRGCFEDKFIACQPDKAEVSNDDRSLRVEFKIIGEGENGCRLTAKYLIYSNPAWNDREITCDFDNKIDFQSSVDKTLKGVARGEVICSGSLYEIIRSK